jgi:tetratricopeptide (TPR) repeat protein
VGKKYALLVGVKDYEHAKLPDLKFTEHDIDQLASLLKGPAARFQVRVLTSSRGKKHSASQPTAANIRRALKALLKGRTKRDTVLIALAGHGLQLRVGGKEESFFCPSDARPADPRTLLGFRALFKELEESGAGVQLLLVDACRTDPAEARNLDADALPRPPKGISALFSCSSGQRAFETDKLKHGVFFHYVLEGLRGKARNEDNEVGWDELTAYVKRQVPRAVARDIGGGARQSPHLVANLTGEPAVLMKLGPRGHITRTVRQPDPARLVARGKAHLDRNEYDQAIAVLSEAIRLAPTNADAPSLRGQAYHLKGDYDRAIADSSDALRHNPRLVAAWFNRGECCRMKNLHDRAIADCTEAVRLDPRYTLAYGTRGAALASKKQYTAAVRDFSEALRLDPKYAFAWFNRGEAQRMRGKLDRAIADCTEAIRLNPRYTLAYGTRGAAQIGKKQYAAAIRDFNEALRLDPKYSFGWFNRGEAQRMRNNFDRAIADCTEAIRLNPRYPLAYGTRGAARFGKKQYKAAIRDFTEAIRLDPRYVFAYQERARAYEALGNKAQAARDRTRAQRLKASKQ